MDHAVSVEVDGKRVRIQTTPEGLEEAQKTAINWLEKLRGLAAIEAELDSAKAVARNLEESNATLRRRVRDLERVIKWNEYKSGG